MSGCQFKELEILRVASYMQLTRDIIAVFAVYSPLKCLLCCLYNNSLLVMCEEIIHHSLSSPLRKKSARGKLLLSYYLATSTVMSTPFVPDQTREDNIVYFVLCSNKKPPEIIRYEMFSTFFTRIVFAIFSLT